MAQDAGVGTETTVSVFADRLANAVDRKRSQLLVGLDPRADLLPVELRGEAHVSRGAAAEACARFCSGLVDAVAPYVVGVKLQLAFFEALGSDGMRAFEEACAYARTAGLLVVADGKRGDIGSTARAYADAYIEQR
jgi:orotidine-5'-phosphate decarboxylase